MKAFVKQTVCVLLALCMFCGILFPLAGSAVDLTKEEQDKINTYQKQQAQANAKITESKEKLNSLKSDIAQQKAYVQELQTQINNYQSKIDALSSQIQTLEKQQYSIQCKIDTLNNQITEIEAEINHNNLTIIAKNQEIEDVKLLLQERLCDLYIHGEASQLELLLASKDFASYLTISELKKQMAEHDTALIDTINDAIAETERLNEEQMVLMEEINAKKAEHEVEIQNLEAKKNELEVPKKELESSQSEVMSLQSEAMGLLNQMDTQSTEYQNMVAKYQAEEKACQAQIDKIIAEAERPKTDFTPSSGLIFPLKNAYISSPFGYRGALYAGGSTYHGGVDACCYSGTQGKPVYAAANGTVFYSGFNSYGNCIMLDHGNGLVTLYGHLDSRSVSYGATVKQGDVIGYAGNTYGPGGYSTGAHLHFEVRVNTAKVNPLNYCSP